MAERIVDLLVKKEDDAAENLKSKKCFTDNIVLEGGDFANADEVENYKQQLFERVKSVDVSYYDIDSLVRNFGSQSDRIIDKFFELLEEHKDAPLIALGRAELWFGIENELVITAADYFIRRTGRLYFDIDSVVTMEDYIIKDLAATYNWDKKRQTKEREEIDRYIFESADIFKEGVVK